MMRLEEIGKKVKLILADKLDIPIEMIKNDSLLVDNLGMDSISALEVVFSIENEFNIKIPQENLVKIKTFKDIIKNINKHVTVQIETKSKRC